MRYFLTKLTFNNHFDCWSLRGKREFCCSGKKFLKSNQDGNILSIVTFSVFYGDLNYISVCLFEGFWQFSGPYWSREPSWGLAPEKQVSTSCLMVWRGNAMVGNSASGWFAQNWQWDREKAQKYTFAEGVTPEMAPSSMIQLKWVQV